MRTSKSWDDDGGAGSALQRRNDNSIAGGEEIALGGTWGDENTSFFGMNGATAAGGGGGGGSRGGESRANNYSWDTNFDFISSSDKKSTKTFGATSTSSRTQRGSSLRASKSWDDDGINGQSRIGSDEGIARWGTWGDDNASLFGVGSAAAGGTGDNVGANAEGRGGRGERQVMSSDTNGLTHQKDDNDNSLSADFNTLEEWDKAEAQWRETISAVGGRAASTSLPSSPQQKIDRNSPRKPANKSHPWSSDEQSMVFEGLDSRSSISRDLGLQSTDVESSKSIPSADEGDDDDDSIFAFGKKDIAPSTNEHVLPVNAEPTQTEQCRVQSPPSPHNPSDIFNKIKSGLKQADKTKNRARGIQGNESDGSYDPSETSNDARRVDDENTLAKVLDSSTMQTSSTLHEETRKKEEKKNNRIKFAMDTQNTVHTYWAESEEDLSEIDKFDYVNNDDRDGSVGNKKTVQSTSTRTGKVAESNKSFRQTENDSLQEGSDNDNDTYGDSTIEDSITYKSGQSEDLRKKDLDELILDHVDNAVTAVAATLGGLFGVGLAQKQSAQSENNGSGGASGADNGRSVVTDDDTTTYDTDTYGESTAFTTLNTGTTRTAGSEYDWLDYMRSFIFPKDMDVS